MRGTSVTNWWIEPDKEAALKTRGKVRGFSGQRVRVGPAGQIANDHPPGRNGDADAQAVAPQTAAPKQEAQAAQPSKPAPATIAHI